MVDASHSFDRSKSHAVEGQGDTEGFNFLSVALLRIVSKLATTVSAQVALLTIAMRIFDNFVAGAMRTIHKALSLLHHSLLCNAPFFNGVFWEILGEHG